MRVSMLGKRLARPVSGFCLTFIAIVLGHGRVEGRGPVRRLVWPLRELWRGLHMLTSALRVLLLPRRFFRELLALHDRRLLVGKRRDGRPVAFLADPGSRQYPNV